MSLNSQQQGYLEDQFYEIRGELERLVSKKYGQKIADTVEQHLTELAEAILKASQE